MFTAKRALTFCSIVFVLTLRTAIVTEADERSLHISVADNGDGYGLHSCAVAAEEKGGTLAVHSDWPGTGAAFTLEIPLAPMHPGEQQSA